MAQKLLLLLPLAPLLLAGPPSYPTSNTACGYPGGGPTATINAGVVIGTTTSLPTATATVNKFLGIPFAKSPPTRFAPPESPGTFSQPIIAQQWSPACIQQFVGTKAQAEATEFLFDNPAPEESEDCLYLNVYAPSTPAPADGRAVLYWIYGGALQFGNAGQHTYDGSWFAAYEDVIVVSVNYRTNVFGFPSSPELPADGHNLGFLDQRFGLQWVQDNIHAFGGSPDKVTIFGESAGSWSVDALVTSYPAGSSPPFRGAIEESGVISYHGSYTGGNSSLAWQNLSAALGCPGKYSSDLECVRAAPAKEIRRIISRKSLIFWPEADNVTLVSDPAERRLSGNIAHVPLLGGSNAQEFRVLTAANDTTTYLESVGITNSSYIQLLEAAYPLGSNGINTQFDQLTQIATELAFQCPAAKVANDTASVGIPSWRYYFNASFENTQLLPGVGVYHSSEIPIVFSTYPPENATTQEFALSSAMRGIWAKFAKNPAGGPGWNPVGTGAAGPVLVGAEQVQVGGIYSDATGAIVPGAFDLGVLGNRLDALSSGVTVIDQAEVDYRCALFAPLYENSAYL